VTDRSDHKGPLPEMPSDCRPIENAFNPHMRGTWTLYVRMRKIQQTAFKGRGAALELAYTVLDALQHPLAVFRGVTEIDDGDEGWLYYVSAPARAYDWKTENTVAAWEGEVFLAFVDEELIVRQWHWTDADPESARLPANHEKGRFRERLI
jgi:hypothetical protein